VFTRVGGAPRLYVGTGDGRLCQIETDVGSASVLCIVLEPGTTIGAPSFDATNQMIYVGSGSGAGFAVSVPLP
jgi:hypothetical protein